VDDRVERGGDVMDFSGPLNPKMGWMLFGITAMAGFLINRSMKLIIGAIISISIAVILFVIVSQNPYIHLDKEVTKRIMDKFYYSWIHKPKAIWDTIIHTSLAEIELKKFYKPLIGLAGFGFGFAFLGKYFGERKPKAPKKK
jgi:hypothetical protein